MNAQEFRKFGKQMIEYICDYMENIRDRDVSPTIKPGFLKKIIPVEVPKEGEDFKDIFNDFEKKLLPGLLHWNHPNFFAYFPTGNSYPSILAAMLSNALGVVNFSWASCPVGTELEEIMLDWYAKALDLPEFFISDSPGSRGGGVLQASASECILVCMLAARSRAINNIKQKNLDLEDSEILPQLVAYTSKEAHSSIDKAAIIALVNLRNIETDAHGRMRADQLEIAIQTDLNDGLTPFFVAATVGTTGACAFDDLTEIGKICKMAPNIWFHVDGAYAGSSFILPEMRIFSRGLEYADSFNTNPDKMFMTGVGASAMWVKDLESLKAALYVNRLYLQHEHENVIDNRHYSISLSKPFRSLEMWFVFRNFGINGLQSHIRNLMKVAKKFEELVRNDERFEVCNIVYLGLVCFRLRAKDSVNQELLTQLNRLGKMHLVPTMFNGKYTIRLVVAYKHATINDIVNAWNKIKSTAKDVLEKENVGLKTPR